MKCKGCGRELLKNSDMIIYAKSEDNVHIYCKNCYVGFGCCPTCVYNVPCGFFDDPDPIPQFVMLRQERRTPMGVQILQKEMPNPERVKKFCIDGKCVCYNGNDEHPLCCRFGGCATCLNYCEVD